MEPRGCAQELSTGIRRTCQGRDPIGDAGTTRGRKAIFINDSRTSQKFAVRVEVNVEKICGGCVSSDGQRGSEFAAGKALAEVVAAGIGDAELQSLFAKEGIFGRV